MFIVCGLPNKVCLLALILFLGCAVSNSQVDLKSEHNVKSLSSTSQNHQFHQLTGNIRVRNVYTENGLKSIQPKKFKANSAPAIVIRSMDSVNINFSEENNVVSFQSYADNCTNPRESKEAYNDSCEFVLEECQHKSELINYLAFVLCDLQDFQVSLASDFKYVGHY